MKIDSFNHFSRYFTLKAGTRRLCMLRELCTAFNIAHHNQYQCDLHSQPVLQAYTMTLQCVYSPKTDENRLFIHFSRYFTLKARARRLCMLRELLRTLHIAHYNQYKDGLNSQPGAQAYTTILQCVYSPKSVKNKHFSHFSRYFTLKARARRQCMLRELCKFFNMAHHNQYQGGLHSRFVLQAYTMMLECVY